MDVRGLGIRSWRLGTGRVLRGEVPNKPLVNAPFVLQLLNVETESDRILPDIARHTFLDEIIGGLGPEGARYDSPGRSPGTVAPNVVFKPRRGALPQSHR